MAKTFVYSDFDIFFRKNALTNDIILKKDADDIKQSLQLLFRTSFYDRKWHPEIGSRLMSLIFQLNDEVTRNLLKEEIKYLIETYETRITITNIVVEYGKQQSLNGSDVYIKVEYEINSVQVNDSYEYTIHRTR